MKIFSQNYLGKALFLLLFFLITSILLLLISIQLLNNTIYDETLYLTHMHLVIDGKVPYHDFFDWIPPVWLYLYAGVFSIFGENVMVARAFSTIIGLLSIGQVVRLAWKFSGHWAALIALAIITCVLPIAVELTRFYYTASAFFFVITAISLEFSFPRNKISIVFVEVLFTLAAGTVQAFGLLILLYPLYLLFVYKNKKSALLAFATGLITGGLVAAPFLWIDSQATLWAMFSYSTEIIPLRWKYTWATYPAYIWRSFATYPLIWVPILYLIFRSTWQSFRLKKIQIPIDQTQPASYFLLWIAYFGIAFAVMLFNPTMFMQQHVYYLPIGSILVASSIVKWSSNLSKDQKFTVSILLMICFVASLFFSKPDLLKQTISGSLYSNGDNLARVITTTKDLIKENPDARVFSFVPYFGLEAGGSIFPGTEYGITSFTLNWPEDKANRYNFFTRSQTLRWIETSQPDLIVTVDKTRQTMSCCGPKNGVEFLDQFEETIPAYYTQVDSFFVNEYWGEARFFKRK
jgi:hypothetical protein